MSDIIVTVPRKEVANFWAEGPADAVEWWTLPQAPKRLTWGDYIYFIVNGEVAARARVAVTAQDVRICEATGRRWGGCHVQWRARDFEELPRPRQSHPGFRGFRYYDGVEAQK